MNRALLLLAIGTAALFGYRLGARSLENQDIIRNADIAAEMLRSGDWLVPRSCDTVYVEKPPLFIWAVAGAGKLMGGVSPLAARLPSLLAGVAFVLATAFLGRFLFNWRAGLLAGLILATMSDVWVYARSARDDMLFAVLTLAALACLLLAADKKKVWGWTAAGLLMAGAMLVKGPLGAGLPLIAFAAWRFTLGWGRKGLWVGAAWALMLSVSLVGLGYYLQVYLHARPGEFREMMEVFFLKENLERVRSGWDHRPKPFYYYGGTILMNTLPWGLLLIPAAVSRWPKRWRGGKAEAFLLLWVALIVLGFSLSAGKHARYLLPVYPALALLLARVLDGDFGREPECRHWTAEALWVFPFLLLAGAAWAAIWADVGVPLMVPALVLVGCALYMAWALVRRDLWRGVLGLALAFAAGTMTHARVIETKDGKASTCRKLAEELGPLLPEEGADDPVYLLGRDFFRSGLCYYLGRTIPIIEDPYEAPLHWTHNRAWMLVPENADVQRIDEPAPRLLYQGEPYLLIHNY